LTVFEILYILPSVHFIDQYREKKMLAKTVVIAEQFVDFVLRYDLSNKIKELKKDDAKILFAVIKAAGFEAKEIIFGTLLGNYRDQDGSFTGETYPINKAFPFKVINEEGEDDYSATGWLDCAFCRVITVSKKGEERSSIVCAIANEIERSVPLSPIQMTNEGDMLCEYPPSPNFLGLEYFIDHCRDDRKLKGCVGIHKYCKGYMDRIRSTEKSDVLVCRRCQLRVYFPKETETYGDLRNTLAKIKGEQHE